MPRPRTAEATSPYDGLVIVPLVHGRTRARPPWVGAETMASQGRTTRHMSRYRLRSKAARVTIAVVAMAVSLVGVALSSSTPSGADPKQLNAFIGMGSNTTQDVVNAFAGESNGNLYTPLNSGSPNFTQVISFDA